MEPKVNVPQIREFLNYIIQAPGKICGLLRVDIRETTSRFLSELMESVLSFPLTVGTMIPDQGRYIGKKPKNAISCTP